MRESHLPLIWNILWTSHYKSINRDSLILALKHEKGVNFMNAQEFKEAQKTANEIAFLLVELKKSDPNISEKLNWFFQGLKMAGNKNHLNITS